MSQEEKDKIKEHQKKISRIASVWKKSIKNKLAFYFFLIIKMSEKAVKFNNIRLNKKKLIK